MFGGHIVSSMRIPDGNAVAMASVANSLKVSHCRDALPSNGEGVTFLLLYVII